MVWTVPWGLDSVLGYGWSPGVWTFPWRSGRSSRGLDCQRSLDRLLRVWSDLWGCGQSPEHLDGPLGICTVPLASGWSPGRLDSPLGVWTVLYMVWMDPWGAVQSP